MEAVQAEIDCLSEIKSAMDAFSLEEYNAIYNLFVHVEDRDNPCKFIYEVALKAYLGHWVDLEN